MKWVQDCNSNWVNLEVMESIHVRDRGLEFTERFVVVAKLGDHLYELKRYRTESGPVGYIKKLMDIETWTGTVVSIK